MADMWGGCGKANCHRSDNEKRVGPLKERQKEVGSVEVGDATNLARSGWVIALLRSEKEKL